MERQMSATQARINFGEVLRYVAEEQQPIIVARAGTPRAVIIAIEAYERLKAGQQQKDLAEALERARQIREKIAARRNGEPLPDPVEMIRQMREERDEQLEQALDLPRR